MWYVLLGLRSLLRAVLFSVILLVGLRSMGETSVLSYKEWKSSKIQTIESRIRQLEEQRRPVSGAQSTDPNLSMHFKKPSEAQLPIELAAQIENEMTILNVVQDLTITDYFVGYLTQQNPTEQVIKEVAGKLSTEEVAELMAAYAQHVASPRPKTR
jgi:hypothetical protein